VEGRAARRPAEREPLSPTRRANAAGAAAGPGGEWEPDTIPDLGELPRGAHVGEYRIRRKLEEGGMGTVYSAVHPIIERKVAIKVLHAALSSDATVVARFVQEARAACRVGHPGIVDVFGFGQLPDGRHYIIMEYLSGQQLLELLRERAPLLPEIALPIVRGICEPLAAAHQANIVHRDLKPENVFLVPQPDGQWPPRVKVLDFGLAKLLEPHRQMGPTTKTGTTLGTCYYMAPEQCRGHAVDARSDIYSLGVMMYEMMTGRVPFYSPSPVEVMFMHLRDEPEPPSRHARIDRPTESLILDCLAKPAAERPQTVADVLARVTELEEAHRRRIAAHENEKQIAAVTSAIAEAATKQTTLPDLPIDPPVRRASDRRRRPFGERWLVPILASVTVVLAATLGVVLWLLLRRP
jgi:serine/threonine-protein kinase